MENGKKLYQKKHCIGTSIRQYSQLEMISAENKIFIFKLLEKINKIIQYQNNQLIMCRILNREQEIRICRFGVNSIT